MTKFSIGIVNEKDDIRSGSLSLDLTCVLSQQTHAIRKIRCAASASLAAAAIRDPVRAGNATNNASILGPICQSITPLH